MRLSDEEIRVLGCLVEKQLTTPDYYPLTLNALVTACNQSSNRFPVVEYDQKVVHAALESLRGVRKLARIVYAGAGSRVDRFRHILDERLELSRPEKAVLCVLMLRGPQTVGEIKGRTERMHPFDTLEDVETVLDRLADPAALGDPEEPSDRTDSGMLSTGGPAERREGYARPWDGPLIVRIPRQPGQKEGRVAHTLAGPPDLAALAALAAVAESHSGHVSAGRGGVDGGGGWRERAAELEQQVEELRSALAALRREFEEFARQFG